VFSATEINIIPDCGQVRSETCSLMFLRVVLISP